MPGEAGDIADVLIDVPDVADALVAAREDVDARPHDDAAQKRYWDAIRNVAWDEDWEGEGLIELLNELVSRIARKRRGSDTNALRDGRVRGQALCEGRVREALRIHPSSANSAAIRGPAVREASQ